MTKPRIRNVLAARWRSPCSRPCWSASTSPATGTTSTQGAGLVNVLVASRDIPAGTDGLGVASGGYLKTESVPKRTLVHGSVASAAPLTSQGHRRPDLQGRADHAPPVQAARAGRHLRQVLGHQRAVAVPGDRARCSPARSRTATASMSSRTPATTSGPPARDDARRPAEPARAQGARRRRRRRACGTRRATSRRRS